MSNEQFFAKRAIIWLNYKKDLIYDELALANNRIIIRTDDKFTDLTDWFNRECLLSNGTYQY